MFVFDWLFGHHEKEPFTGQSGKDNHNFGDSTYHYCSHDNYAQQDFDDDLDIFDGNF